MIKELSEKWRKRVEKELFSLSSAPLPPLTLSTPPDMSLGDIAFPMFAYAKALRKSPNEIALLVKGALKEEEGAELSVVGPYLNIKFDISLLADRIISNVKEGYGKNERLKGKRIMIEFSCPNTNKPLHLGHLRNDALGESVAKLLKLSSADVLKVNLINNRGIHICKSMLSYMKFSNGETPEKTGEKGDHFVGRYYVKYAKWEKEDGSGKPQEEAQALLKKWEEGDSEVVALWEKMNSWTLSGLFESYEKMGITFDRLYYESDTYKSGKEEIIRGVKEGVFQREEDGSVQVDLSEIGLDKKVLLRKDGTTLYITQDIGTAVQRHSDWPFDSLIYVVASEQNYHFKVLFHILSLLRYSWAKGLYHLSYGMVNLPEGKMKSREGTVVDGDDLLFELSALAKNEIIEKKREGEVDGLERTAEKIALAALNYYLLQVSPQKDMVFDSKASISFNGNTGPYMQYMAARINSILDKYCGKSEGFDGKLLTDDDERSLLKLIDEYPDIVEKASEAYDPSLVSSWLYSAAKTFSHYYHEKRILDAETKDLASARVALLKALLAVMKEAFSILSIPFLHSM